MVVESASRARRPLSRATTLTGTGRPAVWTAKRSKSALGQFGEAKSDAQPAMRLSPRDPSIGLFPIELGYGTWPPAFRRRY
jgi:hypothetical protein